MPYMLLNVGNHLPGVGFIPAPIEVLGHDPELDDEIAGQILWLDFAALFAPKPQQSLLIIAHDDPGIRTADKVAPSPDVDPRLITRTQRNGRERRHRRAPRSRHEGQYAR